MNGQIGNLATRQINKQPLSEGVLRWRMETEEVIRKFEDVLLGRIFNPVTRSYEDDKDEDRMVICNKKGVAYARAYLTALINKNTLQGNLTEEVLLRQLEGHAYTICEHIGIKYRDYGITPELRRTYIYLLMGQVMIALTRPIGDKEREHAIESSKEQVHTSTFQRLGDLLPGYGPPQANKGLL